MACKTAGQAARVGRQAMAEVWQWLLPQLYEMEREVPGSRCFTFRCVLCPEGCTRPQGRPCRHPDKLRHSLESVGFDIEAMTRDLLDIHLEWSHDGSLPKHITLVTALFS
jgi:predicted metal-binding protein